MHTDLLIPIAMDLLLKSCGILLIAFTLQSLWRHASAAQRCLTWGAAFLALGLLPLTLLLPARWTFAWERADMPAPAQAITSRTDESRNFPEPATVIAMPKVTQTPPLSAAQWVFGIWLTGVALVMGWRVLGAWQVRRLHSQSTGCHDARVADLTRRLAREAGIRRGIEVRESADVSVPLTWGVLRPVLLLPREAPSWNDAAVEAALRHELGHVRHLDALTRLLATMACAAFWPNALAWLAAKAWRTAQEQACDDLVIRAGATAQDYAMQLLHAAQRIKPSVLRHAPVMAMAKPSTLEARLSAIMDDTRDRRPLRRRVWLTGGAGLALLLALCAVLQLRAEDKPEKPPVSAKADNTLSTGQVRVQARFIETPAGTLSSKAGMAPAKPTDAVEAVLTREESADLLKRAEQTREVTLLSAPSVTTHLGQQAIVETGKNLPDAKTGESGADWEGIHFEVDPKSGKDDKHLNMGLTVVMRRKKGQDADGKPVFGEMRFSRMIANYEPGATVLIRGAHPSDARREIIVLVSAEMASGDAIPKAAPEVAPTLSRTKAKADAIILPSVKLSDATLAEALYFLRIKAAELDPDKQGVNIIFADPAPNEAHITLDLVNIPLSEALHYVTQLANVKLRYDENAVTIGVAAEADAGAGGASPKEGASTPSSTVGNLPTLVLANKIILPSVQFANATAEEAVEFLRVKSKMLDPEQRGVNILLRPPTPAAPLNGLTLELKDIPLSDAVKYVAELAGLKVKYEPYAILLEAK